MGHTVYHRGRKKCGEYLANFESFEGGEAGNQDGETGATGADDQDYEADENVIEGFGD